ncbi:MAG: MerR family transcriptional regulator [Acetatifactor sp.]|nr:MerR family transcriptional regulator [Acetatifactor sp.]
MNDKTRAVYRIGELSGLTGVKAGTIRFYEKCGFIGPVERASNGYRIYHERNVFQLRVCRLVFGGFVNKKLRRESLKVLDASAGWDLEAYERECANYQRAIEEDIERTRKAIDICMAQMSREERKEKEYSKKQAAAMVGVTPEAIRNWERNGLLGCYEPYQRRFYGQALLNRMYVIRLLLDTGYSMMTIRSFMQEYDDGQPKKAEQLLINPREREELCYRSDRYLEALLHLQEKALQLREMKSEMEKH